MPRKLNCWQFKNCGREKGGIMAEKLGECPVSSTMRYDGLNDGIGAGRACWMVPSNGCRGHGCNWWRNRQCHECEFYQRVVFEEESACFTFSSTPV
jgi:hypothetical protein